MATRVGGIVFHKLGGFTVLARLSIDCNFNSDSLLVSQAFTSNCKRSSIIAIPAFPIPWAMLCAINQLLASYQSRFLLSCLACLLVPFFCLFGLYSLSLIGFGSSSSHELWHDEITRFSSLAKSVVHEPSLLGLESSPGKRVSFICAGCFRLVS